LKKTFKHKYELIKAVIYTFQSEIELKETLDEPTKEIAEKYLYSNAMFLVMVEKLMDEYRNKKISNDEVVKRIDEIESRFG
jgi:hypothetical protein